MAELIGASRPGSRQVVVMGQFPGVSCAVGIVVSVKVVTGAPRLHQDAIDTDG